MIDATRRRALRAQAHGLAPVVTVGAAGVTPGVVAETARALDDHELIKVRFAASDRDAFRQAAGALSGELDADLVQTIGRIAVLFRQRDHGGDQT